MQAKSADERQALLYATVLQMLDLGKKNDRDAQWSIPADLNVRNTFITLRLLTCFDRERLLLMFGPLSSRRRQYAIAVSTLTNIFWCVILTSSYLNHNTLV